MLLSNLCSLCDFSQCLQRFNAISIITQCALNGFSILLITWIELTLSFKTSLSLYVLLTECKCYQDAKSVRSQSNDETTSLTILSVAVLILKTIRRIFFKKISSLLVLTCKIRICLLHINILKNRNDMYHIFYCQIFECHVCFFHYSRNFDCFDFEYSNKMMIITIRILHCCLKFDWTNCFISQQTTTWS